MKDKQTEEEQAEKVELLTKEILEVIKKDPDMCFIQEIFIEYSGCCSSTFYEYGLEKSEDIKKALENNRTTIKKEMRGNWKKKDAGPALQIGAFKLMGTDSERKRLSQTYTELTGSKGGPVETVSLTTEEWIEVRKQMKDEDDCQ